MHGTERPRFGGFVSTPGTTAPTATAWAGALDAALRDWLHTLAQRLASRLGAIGFSGLPPAPESAARSERDSTAAGRGSLPGVPPAPAPTPGPPSFPTAAGWVPALPPELRTPPVRLTASGVFRAVDDERSTPDRRYVDRRIRDDGSPYGVERRRGAQARGPERRGTAASAVPTAPARPAGAALTRAEKELMAHYPDLLARFHGR
jgi:hypothetical protein